MKPALKHRIKLSFRKIYHQEYWSFYIFYIPMLLYGITLAIKARSLMYFIHTNPKLKYSGAFDMLKIDILNMTPSKFLPITDFVSTKNLNTEDILNIAKKSKISYPFILKPNIGERGKNVAKIRDLVDLNIYLKTCNEDLIIQEYVGYETYPIEAGVFINKDPETKKVTVTNLSYRKFPVVIGDGFSTLDQIVERDTRCVYRYSYYKNKFKEEFQRVIPKDEEVLLEAIGSHNRGTGFVDKNYLINEKLEKTFEEVVGYLDNYFYGRFDIKAKSFEDICNGDFKILEINGINAEPISIYDAKCSFFKAYKELMRHMKMIYKISTYNKKQNNCHPKISFSTFIKACKHHISAVKQTAEI